MGEKGKKKGDSPVYFIKIPYLCSVIRMSHEFLVAQSLSRIYTSNEIFRAKSNTHWSCALGRRLQP